MANTVVDLWPTEFGAVDAKLPAEILQEQASLLGAKTKNVLEGQVRTSIDEYGSFWHRFYINAPALGSYRYLLLTAKHEIVPYPVQIDTEDFEDIYSRTRSADVTECKSELELQDILKRILNSERCRSIVQNLLRQSMTVQLV
jgi:hypothetical protein